MYRWILPAVFATDLFLLLWNLWRLKKFQRYLTQGTFMEVLMFPDPLLHCKAFHFLPTGCRLGSKCKKDHSVNSMVKLLQFLLTANTSVDVCVFNITCLDLVDILIDLRSRKVKVRVVTDAAELTGTQVPKLLNNGVPVRSEKNCGNLMHHKFVIIDNSAVATGSFNWTQQAVVGNNENLIITNHKVSVDKYAQEFNKLWVKFNSLNTRQN
ncbi:uncharacterized protein LOC142337587 [Convolutriloba macropyga]|uniref:uncharacterized protein LOC142337587 n=1 Tax=Convolutriloba macropyga TaxID=536237 RepID=UPI003F51C4B4